MPGILCVVFLAMAFVTPPLGPPTELRPGAFPRSAGSTLFPDDKLSVWIAPPFHTVRDRQFEPKAYEPIIESVDFLLDGKKANLPVEIGRSSYGKMGWSQSAAFTVPGGLHTVKALLNVQFIGKTFQITVPFEPSKMAGNKWETGKVDVIPIKQPADQTLH